MASEVIQNTGQISDDTGQFSEDIGDTLKDIGQVSNDIGQISKDTGLVLKDTGQVSNDIGDTLKDTGQVSNDIGQISKDTGLVLKDTGQVSKDIGDTLEDTGQVSKDTGEVPKDIQDIFKDTGQVLKDTGEVPKDIRDIFEDTGQVLKDTGQVLRDIEEVSEDIEEVSKDIEEVSEDIEEVSEDQQMGPLQRRPAFRRKGYAWTSKTLSQHSGKSSRVNVSLNEDADENDDHNNSGSSLDLAPSLLTIYDSIAAGNSAKEIGLLGKTDGKSKSLPASARQIKGSGYKVYNKERPKTMIDPTGNKEDQVDTADTKKRPLSISSSSSASSSSLTRHQRKRPNLTLCDEHHKVNGDAHTEGRCNHDVNGNTKVSSMEYESLVCDHSPMETYVIQSSSGSVNRSPGENNVSSSGKKVSKSTKRPYWSSSPSKSSNTDVCSTSNSKKTGNVNAVSGIKNKASTLPCVSQSSTRQASQKGSSSNHASSPSSPKSFPRDASSTSSTGSSKPHYVSYVQRVVSEIIDSERIYVKSLEDIIQGYLEYLEKSPEVSVTDEDLRCLFSNIRQIYEFGRLFLWELEQCDREPVRVAECFVRNNEGFVIYTDYCTNYPSAVEVLTSFMADPNMSEVFKNRQFILGHGLPLGAYLLKPVQRILKYHLLLQNILKFFEKEKPGYCVLDQAFKHMTQMAHHINEMKRKHEHAVRIQEIQSQLEDYAGKDLTCLGELVLEGSFRVYGAKASRQVFLFEKDILISKKKPGGMLGCKAQVQMANLMLVEVIPNEPLSFHIIPFDNPRAQYTLQARNMEQKRRWCQEIKRLILETYKGKIPDNVKELVMELGRNHDDDYVNSENLDPRRQHHTAPEYLEKRRIRRKSGSKMPDFSLLKPQKAKRTPRKQGDRSPSPLRQRRSAPSVFKSDHSPEKSKVQLERSISNTTCTSNTIPRETTHRQLSPVQQSPKLTEKSPTHKTHTTDDINVLPNKTLVEKAAVAEGLRRAKSFRKATRMRPVNSQDLSDLASEFNITTKDRCSDSESDIDDPNLTKDGLKEYSDYIFDSRSDLSEDERIDTQAEAEIDQYCSLPVLPNQYIVLPPHELQAASVVSPELKSEKNIVQKTRSSSPNLWKKHKSKSTDNGVTDLIEKRLSNPIMSPDNKKVNAFNDSFSRMSQQNLVARALRMPMVAQRLSLDGDKFEKDGNKAKLTNWNSTDKLTKGSMSDVSHLSEDPWVKVEPSDMNVSSEGMNMNNNSRPQNYSDASEIKARENIDWMVYINRNSLNENCKQLKFLSKNWTLPRASTSPPLSPENNIQFYSPPASPSHVNNHEVLVKTAQASPAKHMEESVVLTLSPIPKTHNMSSVPAIVVSNSSLPSSPKHHHHHHCHHQGKPYLSRSNSTPLSKSRIEFLNMFDKNRPASLDCDVMESDKMVAEMEDYMKNSLSESSFSNRFPKDLPALNYDEITRSKRLSCASSVSTSSYDSHTSSSTEGLMETLKHKIHNWTSKIAKRMEDSDHNSGTSSVSDVRPSSLVVTDDEKWEEDKNKSEDKGITSLQKQLQEDAELQMFLRQRGLGGGSIGSRMAHALPKNTEALFHKIRPHSAHVIRGDNDSLSSYELSSKESTPEPHTRFSLPPLTSSCEAFSPISLSAASSEVQQSDSGFSMHSDVTDSFSTENITQSSKDTLIDSTENLTCSKDSSKDALLENITASSMDDFKDFTENLTCSKDSSKDALLENITASSMDDFKDFTENLTCSKDSSKDALLENITASSMDDFKDFTENLTCSKDSSKDALSENVTPTSMDDFKDGVSTENITCSSKQALIKGEKQICNCEKEQNVDEKSCNILQSENKEEHSPVQKRNRTHSSSSTDSVDSFYERRLSVAFESDVFHELPSPGEEKFKPVVPTPRKNITSIRDFVQILEERSKPKIPQTVEVKKRQPGCMIQQRLQFLQEASQYKRGSRPSSEERDLLPPKSIKDMQAALVHETKLAKQTPSFGTLHCGTLSKIPASSSIAHVSNGINTHMPCLVPATSISSYSSSSAATQHVTTPFVSTQPASVGINSQRKTSPPLISAGTNSSCKSQSQAISVGPNSLCKGPPQPISVGPNSLCKGPPQPISVGPNSLCKGPPQPISVGSNSLCKGTPQPISTGPNSSYNGVPVQMMAVVNSHSSVSHIHNPTAYLTATAVSCHPGLGVCSPLSGSNTSVNSSCSSSVNMFSNQFMPNFHRAESEHGFDSPAMYSGMQHARSLGRLDELSKEVENLVIMKGWVRSLISKFQNEG